MMINKRLIATVAESQKYIAGNVVSQWVSLCSKQPLLENLPVLSRRQTIYFYLQNKLSTDLIFLQYILNFFKRVYLITCLFM